MGSQAQHMSRLSYWMARVPGANRRGSDIAERGEYLAGPGYLQAFDSVKQNPPASARANLNEFRGILAVRRNDRLNLTQAVPNVKPRCGSVRRLVR